MVKVHLRSGGIVENVWAEVVALSGDEITTVRIDNHPLGDGYKLGDVIDVRRHPEFGTLEPVDQLAA